MLFKSFSPATNLGDSSPLKVRFHFRFLSFPFLSFPSHPLHRVLPWVFSTFCKGCHLLLCTGDERRNQVLQGLKAVGGQAGSGGLLAMQVRED